jgi:hypothetical protein
MRCRRRRRRNRCQICRGVQRRHQQRWQLSTNRREEWTQRRRRRSRRASPTARSTISAQYSHRELQEY